MEVAAAIATYAPWMFLAFICTIVVRFSVCTMQATRRARRTQDALEETMKRVLQKQAAKAATLPPPAPRRKITLED